MKEKTKKKVLKVSLMVVLLIVFVYVTFKTTLVVISNKYLTDIGDYSTNDKYTFTYTEPNEKLTFKNITIRNDFKDYNVFNSSNGVIYNLKNEETKSMFYITIEDDKILKNTKIKSYLKKNNINTEFINKVNNSTSMVLVTKSKETPLPIFYRSADYNLEYNEDIGSILKNSKIVHFSCWPISQKKSRKVIEKVM